LLRRRPRVLIAIEEVEEAAKRGIEEFVGGSTSKGLVRKLH